MDALFYDPTLFQEDASLGQLTEQNIAVRLENCPPPFSLTFLGVHTAKREGRILPMQDRFVSNEAMASYSLSENRHSHKNSTTHRLRVPIPLTPSKEPGGVCFLASHVQRRVFRRPC